MAARSENEDWEGFTRRSLPLVVAVLVRVVRDAVIAFDVALEALASARLRQPAAAGDDERLLAVLAAAHDTLALAAARGVVPCGERRRNRDPARRTLSIAEQQQIARLAEQVLTLDAAAQAIVDRLARDAPPPSALRAIRSSPLVDGETITQHVIDGA